MKRMAAVLLAGILMFCGAAAAGAEAPVNDVNEVEAEEMMSEEIKKIAEYVSSLWADTPSYGYRGDETVEEQVLFDEEGFKVTAVGLELVMSYPVLKLMVENTSGRDLTFDLEDLSLNGWRWYASLCLYGEGDDPTYTEESELTVADGETLSCGIGFSNEYYFEKCGITAFSEIGFRMRAFEPEEWENALFTPQITIPTSAAGEDTDIYEERGTLAWDEDGLRIFITDREDYEYSGPSVFLYIDNQSEKDVFISAENCLVNRKEADPWFSAIVTAGQRSLESLGFGSEVDSVNRLEVAFRIEEYIPYSYDAMELIGISDAVEIVFDDGIDALSPSPEWVGQLEQAAEAEQMFVVAGVGETTAYVSMHVKDGEGNWKEIFTTPGYIGKCGLGKTKEGDAKTPVGTFHFTRAFGIAENPGSVLPYHQVTEDDYWSGDSREGYHYNEMVSIQDLPDLSTEDSEHLMDYMVHYQYCLNISYNEDGTPGKGSAIFLHCLGPQKPYTGGCVAIPQDKMIVALQNVTEDCVVVIDTLEKLCPDLYDDWDLGPREE